MIIGVYIKNFLYINGYVGKLWSKAANEQHIQNMCSHGVSLLARGYSAGRIFNITNKLQSVITDKDVFYKKICEILERFSLFPGFLVEF